MPVGFIIMISVDDADPVGTIADLRKSDKLPPQYKQQIYDNSHNNTRSFIFIINDKADN